MPAISIDTFFACSLLVSVAIISTAFMAGTLQVQINSMQDLNKEDYLHGIADRIVSSYGAPKDWGSASGVPTDFGLASSTSAGLYTLDIDKISRLNSQNEYSLSYAEISWASRLYDIAFGVSVSQMLAINVELSGNSSTGNTTSYTFKVSVSQDAGPVSANLRCYFVATNFLDEISNYTTSTGVGYVSVEVPKSSSGPALLAVFARASFNDRITAYEVYAFGHLSEQPPANGVFLGLSPLNYTLNVHQNFQNTAVQNGYVFSYAYWQNLTSTSNATYAIPSIVDKSPLILVAQGINGTTHFAEWTSYPHVPLETGANFEHSEQNVFTYTVIIKDALYKLTLRFGDVVR
jgi:hypothetical protein